MLIVTNDAGENVCYIRLEKKQHHQGRSKFQCEKKHKGNIQEMRFKIQNFCQGWVMVSLWEKFGS